MKTPMGTVAQGLVDYFRCPETFLKFALRDLADETGYFRFGCGVTCYGRSFGGHGAHKVQRVLYDVAQDVVFNGSSVYLPFDPTEIVQNLRLERYPCAQDSRLRLRAKGAYYLLRPIFPFALRRQIQKCQLTGWKRSLFPSWPIDHTIESIWQELLLLALKASRADRIPFIWFWPNGATAALIMTHDVESEKGRRYCSDLMDIDDRFDIKASFQIVPEGRYSINTRFLDEIQKRGFEVALHGLTHDGRLFDEREKFLRRAQRINEYAKLYGAKGFRSAVLYRKPDWYDAFDFSYDMSIPNTAHLDPQRGGCCTVTPYFIGNILELPVTTTQDYMLFHLLGESSIDLWKKQMETIADQNGLVSFIIHPDYAIRKELKHLYNNLLSYLSEVRSTKRIWVALPSEVDRWWRARSKMRIAQTGNAWRIEGEGADRAILAYAREDEGKLVYKLQPDAALAH